MPILDLEIDFRSEVPIFMQLVEQIQNMVLGGQLLPGDQLPTVRQLAAYLRVNFNTVARAYRLLDKMGLLSTQHGRGTYIWEPPDEEKIIQLRSIALEGLTRQYLYKATAMGLQADEILAMIDAQMKKG